MKILVTGGTGMVGNGFTRLKTPHELILVGSSNYDLTVRWDCQKMFDDIKPDAVIHLAAKVGGVKGNSDYVADFFTQNILINTNILEISRQLGIKKVVSLLSTCIYPDSVSYPLTEDQIHNGEPHQSNFGYAYAKRMLEVHSRAIRQQYGLDYVTMVPNNLYGPNDNFHKEHSHVIPAMIRKFWDAKASGAPVVFWGSGRPLREFTFSKDIAEILLWAAENYSDPQPLNIGNTGEIQISDLASMIADVVGYDGDIYWDINKPEGQYKKPSSNSRFINEYGNYHYTSMKDGLKETVDWYRKNYPNVRGVE